MTTANKRVLLSACSAILGLMASPLLAQDNGVYKSRVQPNWLPNGTQFWYRNNLPDSGREFVFVDAELGTRQPAFDHDAVAKLIGADDAKHLPVESLQYGGDANQVTLNGSEQKWLLDLSTGDLTEGDASQAETGLQPLQRLRPSRETGPETEITIANQSDVLVKLFWIDDTGNRQAYGEISPGSRKSQHTYSGHVWLAATSDGAPLVAFQATGNPSLGIVTGERKTRGRRSPSDSGRRTRGRNLESPDGEWTVLVTDHNIQLRATSTNEVVSLSKDGGEGNEYGTVRWSPDSKSIVAWRTKPGDRKEVHILESSPAGGGRARLRSRPYGLPGDKFSRYELNVFDVASRTQTKPSVEQFEHEWLRPQINWLTDQRHFIWSQEDRGHQRFRIFQADAETGEVKTILDEKTDTFIWTTHIEMLDLRLVNPLNKTDEVIYVSERDGWRHLYLIDALQGGIKNAITAGEFVVRGIDRIDEEKRQVWFHAGGKQKDQDPYFVHYYRVNFDGSELVALTEGNGTHSVEYSPDGHYLIDRWSRVDAAPTHSLHRVSDGKLVCELEVADTTELEANGWQAPEVFVAKGRDGATDIWGIICRPSDFDPSKQYPVVENIYAGPQGAYVPKSFSTRNRFASLTNLGFVVVQMDGMGTAFRSKAFHDVCWKNLADAGFEDRILWHKSVAEKYPWYDTSRVGIYGTSAGGQNAAGAVLFHPEFYDAAVANCGCHDNRMDKASWNEQWMGYPVGPQYGESSNIDNAHKLGGELFLIVGEGDTNVPPESTLRMVDALIKADKDFDLLVCPNENHGTRGPAGRYVDRRQQAFFVRHLLGIIPPKRNEADGLEEVSLEKGS